MSIFERTDNEARLRLLQTSASTLLKKEKLSDLDLRFLDTIRKDISDIKKSLA